MLHGAAGLEYSYNSLLAGRSGSQVVQLGAGGQPIPAAGGRITPAVPGRDAAPDHSAGSAMGGGAGLRGAGYAGEGRQLHGGGDAAADGPGARDCRRVERRAAVPPRQHPAAADPAVSDVFEPGSTAKVITAAAALEQGGQTPYSPYTVPYQITVDGFQFHDADQHPTERLTLAGILVHSSNVGMVQVVQHVSPQVQYRYFRNFGIGQPTGRRPARREPGHPRAAEAVVG